MKKNFPGLEISIVNPAKRRRKKAKKVARKGGKRRRSNPTTNPAPARRRRRRSTSSPPPRRRRRRNPERAPLRSQGAWPLRGADYRMVIPMVGQKVLTALVVTKWGEDGRLISGTSNKSDFAGKSWPLRNYLMSLGVGVVGAKLVASRFGRKAGEFWYLSNVADMAERMVWSELFNGSKWGPKYFGQSPSEQMAALRNMGYDPSQADAMAGQAMPGAIYDTPSGRFMLDNQRRWQPMQGFGDSLVSADTGFDGFGDSLVAADTGFDGFGHALPPGVDDMDDRYRRTGAVDAYANAWMTY